MIIHKNVYRVVQPDFTPEIEVLDMLIDRCNEIRKALSNRIHNTSISCVTFSWTPPYSPWLTRVLHYMLEHEHTFS